MKLRAVTLATLLAGLVLSACGSSHAGGTGTTRSASGTFQPTKSRPTRLYTVTLSGHGETPAGAAQGRGVAIVAFHGTSLVCWRFAHLHGFTVATGASIASGARGQAGKTVVALSGGPRLHHQGCAALSPSLTRAIWSHPGGYYVNILSAQYPRGAVRAQL